MARKHLAPYRAQRSARLTGFGLGRVSVLISKPGHQDGQACFRRPKRESNREAAVVDRTHHQAGQDRSQVLPDALLEEILKDLAPNDARTCSAVCKRWKLLSDSETVWKPLCEELWSGKQYTPPLEQGLSFKTMFHASLAESERTDLMTEELCRHTWTFRFKVQAGDYWTSFDPYWTKEGPVMQRQFRADGSISGAPAEVPLWNPAVENRAYRWRFTKTSQGRRGLYVKVNHWPALSISRTEDWGWRMENCWVVYLTIPKEQPRPDAQDPQAAKFMAS